MTIIKEPNNIWNELCEACRCLNEDTKRLITFAFNHGGFVAGGFAREVLTPMRALDANDDGQESEPLAWRVNRYLKRDSVIDRKNPWWKALRGDIDIFFPTINSRTAFFKAVALDNVLSKIPVFDSKTKACKEFDCEDTSVGVVVMCQGDVEDLLSSFDIQNAMIAFDDEYVYRDSSWLDLEAAKTFHVASWSTSTYAVARTFKWFSRRGYERFSLKTSREFPRRAMDEAAKLRAKPGLSEPDLHLLDYRLFAKLRAMLPLLSSEDIVLLMNVIPADNYGSNIALKTLVERGMNVTSFSNKGQGTRKAVQNSVEELDLDLLRLHRQDLFPSVSACDCPLARCSRDQLGDRTC